MGDRLGGEDAAHDWMHARAQRAAGGATKKLSFAKLFPMFVLGFVALSFVRSAGDFTLAQSGAAYGLIDAASWSHLVKSIGEGTTGLLLGTALAGVGLTTTLSGFKRVGLRPLLVGFADALLVGAASLGPATVVGPWLG